MTASQNLRKSLAEAAASPELDDPRVAGGVRSVLKAHEVGDRVLKEIKLLKLKIDEISGVDRPANELDGWMVVKRKPEPEYDRAVIQEAARLAVLQSRGSIRIW